MKIIHIQQTSLSRWYYICNIFWSVFISIHRNFVFSKQIVVNSIDWFVWVYLQWIWNGFWEFLCLYMEGHSIASLLFYSLDRTMGCHELIILIRSSGNALCFRCWEYSAAPLAPSPVFLSALIKFSDAKTKTSSSSISFVLSLLADLSFPIQCNPYFFYFFFSSLILHFSSRQKNILPCVLFLPYPFLAVQDSSISDIVGLSVCLSQLTIRA